ncbi:hypothetical protein P691DRAFT_759966 [Macrolepiota fuliginosa MF-IS2]|uniref:LysM domain-containing protein n=1 Tax=Macrolepiota fuliginosa MF-IS2 TaxID=1400762 RepID=A0A9P6C220_9AGAR|nr:hypothetical protein P691DRAFT_759966 [Macrolepiota fuliginosa MF-IS2]
MFLGPRFTFGISLIAILATGTVAQYTPSKPCTKTARKWGDTCDDLAQMYEVSNFQLRLFNPWLNLQCGNGGSEDFLCLAKKGEDCTELFEVLSVDNDCEQLVRELRLDMDVFLANNGMNKEDCYRIHSGQMLCIAPDAIPYGHSE